MSLDYGPVEASMRAQAVAARRRLFGTKAVNLQPKVGVVRHILVPPPTPIAPATPAPDDIAYAPASVRGIILEICAKHNVSRADLMSMRRRRDIIKCRQECCYELRQRAMIDGRQISLMEIARHMGGLDHTTVLYSIRKFQAMKAAS